MSEEAGHHDESLLAFSGLSDVHLPHIVTEVFVVIAPETLESCLCQLGSTYPWLHPANHTPLFTLKNNNLLFRESNESVKTRKLVCQDLLETVGNLSHSSRQTQDKL